MGTSLIEKHTALHKASSNYGIEFTGASKVLRLCKTIHRYKTVLDYGCGKGVLAKALSKNGVACWAYDPAVDEYDNKPLRDFDLVVVNNVFECVEPKDLFKVIADAFSYAKHGMFVNIICGESPTKFLDGEQINSIVKSPEQWATIFKCMEGVMMVHTELNGSNLELSIIKHAFQYCYMCRLSMVLDREEQNYTCPQCGFKSTAKLEL